MIRKSIEFKQFLKPRFQEENFLSGSSINYNNDYLLESQDDEEDFHNDNSFNKQRDFYSNQDEDNNLNALNFFEEELSNVISTYDSVIYSSKINTKSKDDNTNNSTLSIQQNMEQRIATSQIKLVGIPGSINKTIKINFESITENKDIIYKPQEKRHNLQTSRRD